MGMAADLKCPIDERITKKLRALVDEGVFNAKEMHRHLKIFVKSLFAEKEMPRIINRRFFPSKDDIRKLIYQHRRKTVHSLIDQEDLNEKIRVWKDQSPDDSWTLRLSSFIKRPLNEDEEDGDSNHCITTEDQSFLLIYQSAWQRRLLQRYGKELVYLDATYRTTKYALPLFFVCVQTNCGYSVVASFIVEREDSASIAEALRIIQENNPQWTCGSFMIDSSEVEANAICSVFPESNIYICDFLRKQAWHRWTTTSKHDVTSQEETLQLLNRVAESCSEEEYQINLKILQNSDIWRNNPKLQQYIQSQWLANDKHKMWVWAYRGSTLTLVANTNNGVEAQNKVFKYEYLGSLPSRTVSSLMTALVEDFFVDNHRKYMLSNVTMSSGWREPTTSVPESLHHRPQYLVQHIRASMIKGADITSAMVTQTGDKAFQVQSSSNSSKYYEVTMGDDSSHEMPSCACREFQRNHLPCKHFCAVFCHCNNVSWNSLSSSYFNNPHFTIDEECVNLVDEISVAEPHEPVNCNGHSIANAAGEIEEAGKQSTELSKKGRITLKQSSKRVRELLQYITNLSYIAESVDAMEEARIQLTKTAEKLKDQCPAIETLLLELPTSKTLTPSLKRKTTPSLKDLPPRRKRRLTKKAKKTVKDLSSSVNHEKLTTDTDVSIGKFLVSKEDVVQRVKEMGKKMSSQYLESLYEKARSCGSDLGDEVQQTAMAVLDECCEEEHHEDILLQISTLAPAEMDMDSKLRLCFLLLHLLVEQGNFPLKRDLAKEKLEAEANMSGLIEALRAMRNLSSSSTLENSEERKGILAKSKNQHIDESKQKGKKRVRFNIPGCKLTSSETYICSVRKDNLLDNLLSSEPNSLSATSVKKGRRYHVCGEVLDFKDFSTLKKPRWLNDKVINAYLSVLQREQNQGHYDHIFTMPSYMAVLWENGRMDQWMYSQVKLSLYKWIFLPINVQGNHWVLLAANIPNGTVDILDSMRGNNNALHQKWIKYMEVRSTRTGDLKDTMWRKGDLMSMQQLDGNSCGAFVMLHALVLTKGLDIRDIGHHHAVRMREFVMSKLIAASTEPPAQRAKCDMVGCSTPKKTPSVNCHVCGRWSHLTCVSLQEKPKEDFLSPICCAQYE